MLMRMSEHLQLTVQLAESMHVGVRMKGIRRSYQA
jgi:hypothetical protein